MHKTYLILGSVAIVLAFVAILFGTGIMGNFVAVKQGDVINVYKPQDTCLYNSNCSNITGQILAVPLDGGLLISRGILIYQPNKTFELFEIKNSNTSSGYEFDKISNFSLRPCGEISKFEYKKLNWPIDDCSTCTGLVSIRLIGYAENDKVALVEFKY